MNLSVKMQYVFFGSGPVAVASFTYLRTIFPFDYVVTKTTTKKYFDNLITTETLVLTDNKSDVDAFTTTYISDNSVGLLIDFGVILSGKSINSFEYGIINSHFSLLPLLRGADPITFAVLEGHRFTGVSLMLVDEGMDTGDILAQSHIKISGETYADELAENLVEVSNSLLNEVVPMHINSEIAPIPQTSINQQPTYTRKISKEDGAIDWTETIKDIDRKVKAFIGWPGVRTTLGGVQVTIERGHIYHGTVDSPLQIGECSKTTSDTKEKYLLVKTADGIYAITQLKPDGKKSMTAEAFIAGYSQRLFTKAN